MANKRKQLQFEPRHSERPSGLKVGDVLIVKSIRKFKRDPRGWWWQPELVTFKPAAR